jgi:hypothetical protein
MRIVEADVWELTAEWNRRRNGRGSESVETARRNADRLRDESGYRGNPRP